VKQIINAVLGGYLQMR